MNELYKRFRPKLFKHVVGQDAALQVLYTLLQNGFPHTLLINGPSGTGKSTIARILKEKLKCSDVDFEEVNCASVSAPIDRMREIKERMELSPMNGDCRIWLFEESQALVKSVQSQQSMLGMLEDTPPHVYFILATTDKDKLLPAILTRCTKIELQPLTRDHLKAAIDRILTQEQKTITDKVFDKIVECANGSAREAIVCLNTVLDLQSEEAQLQSIQPPATERAASEIVRKLIWERGTWKELSQLITDLPEEGNWEGLRQLILGLAGKELLKDGKHKHRAYLVLSVFQYDWFSTKRNGLIRACYEVCVDQS